jgi:hypothetical protein
MVSIAQDMQHALHRVVGLPVIVHDRRRSGCRAWLRRDRR